MSPSSNNSSSRSFRLVCDEEQIPLVEELLRAEGYRFEAEPFSNWCRVVVEEPRPLGSSLAAFFGYIYIQDRSAMLPPLALAPTKSACVLDMCASPGGKSGFLAQLVGNSGFILANEPNTARLATLRANLHRLNLPNVGTSSYPGEKIPLTPESWPYILLDPPCSGWGTLNKNPQAIKMWRGEKVDPLIRLQRALLRHGANLLAPGGLLLYSTCTTNFDENEAQTVFAESELGLERVELLPFPGFKYETRAGGTGGLLVDGEASLAQGFYLSLLRKPGNAAIPALEPKGHKSSIQSDSPPTLEGSNFRTLPPGRVAVYDGKARFIPAGAEILPGDFAWRGALLGKDSPGGIIPDPRMRCLARRSSSTSGDMVVDNVEDVRALIAGQSFRTELKGKRVALWWRELPLGFATLKNGRVTLSFK